GVVFDLAGAVAQRHLLHKPQAAAGSHRCLRQRIQQQSRALRLDQEKGPSTPFQRPPYHSALIPGTSLLPGGDKEAEARSPFMVPACGGAARSAVEERTAPSAR